MTIAQLLLHTKGHFNPNSVTEETATEKEGEKKEER